MKTFYLLLVSALLTACNAGSGEGLDDNGQPISSAPDVPAPPTTPETPEEPAGLQANLESIQNEVLTPICTQCHAGGNAPLGLRMDDLETSAANLINVDSATNSTFKRVLPGDAENSFFYLKIIGAAIAGNQMPLGQTPLDSQTQETIKQWIDSGAPLSSQQLTAAAKTVKASSSSAEISLTFSQPMDSATLQNSSFSLVDALSKNAILAETSINWLTPQVMTLSFTADNLSLQQPILIINQPSLSTVTSLIGHQLDGDRDGIEGGEFHHEITF